MPPTGPDIPFPKAPTCGFCSLFWEFHAPGCPILANTMFEAVPKARDTTFEKVRMGFGKSGLEAMELRDQFGQITVIKFSAIERNAKLSPEAFRFTPPKGADVITD